MLVILQPDGSLERRFWDHPNFEIARNPPSTLLKSIFGGHGNDIISRIIYKKHQTWAYVDENWRSTTKLPINPTASSLLNHRSNRRGVDVAVHGPMIISFPPGDHPQFDLCESKTETLCAPLL